MVKLSIIWVLAALFVCNSLVITLRTNYNAGTLIMWAVSAVLVLYAIFMSPIDAFLAQGFGQVIKYAIWVAIAAFMGMFIFVATSGYANNAKGDERAIIVLGAGLRGEEVGDLLRRRLAAAMELWEQNTDAMIVVTGGQGPHEQIPEALAMQRWLIEQGVPEEAIIVEDKSVSTEENLIFAKGLLAQAGIGATEPVAVVTNSFHCYRAGQYAHKAGFEDVRTLPASMNVSTYIPNTMREVLAIMFMWVFRAG